MRSLLALALLLFVASAVLFNVEVAATDHRREARGVVVVDDAPSHAGSRRTFVLVIDSLRYRTAMDPERMPYLARLRERGVFAEVKTSNDAVTYPSLRAAFTGRDHVSPFGVLAAYARGDGRMESLFGQARTAGLASHVLSDGSFDQFGDAITLREGNHGLGENEPERQRAAFAEAISELQSGTEELTVVHMTYSDHAAHAFGVASPSYAFAFHDLDQLVERADLAVPPDATLVVMGDHGHDEKGDHAAGLDVPTFMLYRGPGFAQGLDLGHVAITDHRYFMSHALELPLSPHYDGGRHPSALVADAPLPRSYAAATPPITATSGRWSTLDFPASERMSAGLLAALIGLAAWAWMLFAGRGERDVAVRGLTLAAAFAPLAFASLRPVNLLLAIALTIAWLVRYDDRATSKLLVVARASGAMACGLGLAAWGFALAALRPIVHEPRVEIIERITLIAAVVGAAVAARYGPMMPAWAALALSALSYPTVYRYGAPVLFAHVWLLFLLFLVVGELMLWAKSESAAGGARAVIAARRRAAVVVAACTLAAFAVAPFVGTLSSQFTFEAWEGLLSPRSDRDLRLLAVLGKASVFLVVTSTTSSAGGAAPRSGSNGVGPPTPKRTMAAKTWARALAAAGAAAFLTGAEHGVVPVRGPFGPLILAALAAFALFSRKKLPAWTPALVVGLSWTAALYLFRPPGLEWTWASWLFGALALSAFAASRSGRPEVTAQAPGFVTMLGLLVAGWVTVAWTLHRFEWTFLHDWVSPSFAAQHIAWFAPLVIGRFALPMGIVLAIVRGTFGRDASRAATLLGGAKAFSLAAIIVGLAAFSVATDVYVEAYQELAIILLLAVVVLLPLSASERGRGGEVKSPARA